jgi:histidyl-tRNA synthetase
MRDFLPDDKALREGVMTAIRESFSAFGYREIETPVAEELERLESGQGGENEKLIFKILRRGLDPDEPVVPSQVADLGLRFDLTLPLARFYATHRAELPSVFRAIQMGPVWRAERPQKGRYRQFTQCDIDVLGEASIVAEIELITAMVTALRRLGVDDATVRLNDRRVLFGILDACGFEAAHQDRVLITIDKLDKVGVSGVADELRATAGDVTPVDRLVKLLGDLASPAPGGGDGPPPFEAVLDALPPGTAPAAEGLAAIRHAVLDVEPAARLVADPTLVRGMGYYTGPIFELAHPSSSGSIGGGGRYDGMIGRFSGTDVPGCGFSIGFERVIALVDPARFRSPRRQVALVYDEGVAPGLLVRHQRRLIDGGANVRLVRRTRNLGRLLGALAEEGFDAYASIDPATGPVEPLELRALARTPRSSP